MKIACVQMDVQLGEVDQNLAAIEARLRETAANGTGLTIFPECAVTGYCFGSLDEARPFAQTIPGPATDRVSELCQELNMFVVFGLLEIDGNSVFNAAVLTGPDGVIGTYRKVHLPFLGVDMHVDFGDRPFAVHEVGGVRVGMLICYDSSFPEATRCLSLLGADVIALPTNWPPGAEPVTAHVIATRSMENSVYFAAANRVGEESGFAFIGRSRICAPNGGTLAASEDTSETILYAEIDPELSRNKMVVREPGRHAIDRMADRRPEMYGLLVESHSLKRPGRD